MKHSSTAWRRAPVLAPVFLIIGLGCSGGGTGSGSPGAAGTTAAAGTNGAAGTAAAAGTSGAAGTNGAAGTTAAAGTSGAAGTNGTAGTNGAAGTSATAGTSGGAGTGAAGTGAAGTGAAVACPTANEDKFSFFLISNKALIREGGADASGMFSKLGGNLGGITGADALCQKAAEFVSPCQKNKVWHAFLSTTTQDAIDRIGTGPWYDRNGRLWSASLVNVVKDRPSDADPAIKNDPPNEEGVPNHNPDGTGQVDNHEILTGTGANGRVYTQTGTGTGGGSTQCKADVGGGAAAWSAERATCWNWTRNTPEGCPRVGRSWCGNVTCTPPGSSSGTNWMSVWNEGGCAPGGTLAQTGGLDGTRRVGSAGGYGGYYCFAVIPHP